jgi:hypothetical protein
MTIDKNKITRNSKNIENKYQEKVYKLEYNKRLVKHMDKNHISIEFVKSNQINTIIYKGKNLQMFKIVDKVDLYRCVNSNS